MYYLKPSHTHSSCLISDRLSCCSCKGISEPSCHTGNIVPQFHKCVEQIFNLFAELWLAQCKCSHHSSGERHCRKLFRFLKSLQVLIALIFVFIFMWKIKQQQSTLQCHGQHVAQHSLRVLCTAPAPRLPFKASCPCNNQVPLFVRANEILFGNNKTKKENKVFSLGFKFVKQNLWDSFQITKATLE